MSGLFRIDGPIYKFFNIAYYLLIVNFLWIIFSLPIISIGASTTAMFYVLRKVLHDEESGEFRDFWKSFKMNFKQATIIWIGLLMIVGAIFFIIFNKDVFSEMSDFVFYIGIAICFQVFVISIYIFPLLSQFEIGTKDLIRTSFLIGNKHLLTTVICILILAILIFLFKFVGWVSFGIYGLSAGYFIDRVTKGYKTK
ncbi:MAG: YesL family protein [Eubacteriales bacterium]